MTPPRRVVVGMSGGVDSSTTAAILKAQGYDVIGVSLRLPLLDAHDAGRGCCGIAGLDDARRVAEKLDIPFYALNYEELFQRTVVDYFFRSYAAGRTPNPCIECNRLIKFGHLLDLAKGLGAEAVATGHYARLARDAATGRRLLLKGVDREKDQSYFLYSLTQEQLARALFPLGEMTKSETRDRARALGLAVSEKPGSQDICFIGGGDYRALLAGRYPEAFQEGPIVDTAGRVLGAHSGAAGFTIGQRKGLGIGGRGPFYVLSVSPATRTVVVGPEEALKRARIRVADLNWVALDPPAEPLEAGVKVRYRQPEQPATLRPLPNGEWEVEFHSPQNAPAPGQSAVFYRADTVLGGGVIQ